jgi:hypothetical protein
MIWGLYMAFHFEDIWLKILGCYICIDAFGTLRDIK